MAHQTRIRMHPALRRPSPPFPRRPPASSGVISRAQGGRAGGGPPRAPLSWGSAWGQAPGRSPRARRPHPATLGSLADTSPRSLEPRGEGGSAQPPRARAYPVRSGGRTRSSSAPRPASCGGAAAATRDGPGPARPASPPWRAAAGAHWRFLEGAAVTQAGRLPAPVPKQTNGPCARPGRFRKRLFCAFGQSQARLKKNPRTWTGRKEGKREGRGRERSGMCRGGGRK